MRSGHAELLAERIPQAQRVELPGADHVWYAGDVEGLFDQIETFLTGARAQLRGTRVLTTVLFTDVVGSTDRAVQLGDRAWTALLQTHDELVRGQVEAFRGKLVKTTGDGTLAMFDGPARAIHCAAGIRDAVKTIRPLRSSRATHRAKSELRGAERPRPSGHIGVRIASLADAGTRSSSQRRFRRSSRDPESGSANTAGTHSRESHRHGMCSPSSLAPDGTRLRPCQGPIASAVADPAQNQGSVWLTHSDAREASRSGTMAAAGCRVSPGGEVSSRSAQTSPFRAPPRRSGDMAASNNNRLQSVRSLQAQKGGRYRSSGEAALCCRRDPRVAIFPQAGSDLVASAFGRLRQRPRSLLGRRFPSNHGQDRA